MPKQVTIATDRGTLSCTLQDRTLTINDVTIEASRLTAGIRFLLTTNDNILLGTVRGPIRLSAQRKTVVGWSYYVTVVGLEHKVKKRDLEELLMMLEAHRCQSR